MKPFTAVLAGLATFVVAGLVFIGMGAGAPAPGTFENAEPSKPPVSAERTTYGPPAPEPAPSATADQEQQVKPAPSPEPAKRRTVTKCKQVGAGTQCTVYRLDP
ncbi:hypothetical protein [Streptomyces sp. NPDC127112]|uniref:hypothetical protein n=1 Tax=Streptomyces sp. NPDC127112 TaxID=3345364 RepID=UPI0036409BDF